MAYTGKIAAKSTAGSDVAVKILKTVYESGIQEALPLEFQYYKFAKANADDIRFKGDHWEFDVHFARNDRSQAFLPSETLPTSGVAVFDIAKLGIARVAAPLAIDHELVMLAKDDESAFAVRGEALYQDTKDALFRNMNRMAVGDGTGVMGIIATSGVGTESGSGAASRVVLTLTTAGAINGALFFEEGQAVEVWDTLRTTQRGATAGYVVKAVTDTTITIGPADGSTTDIDTTSWVATDVVVRKGSQNGDGTSKEMSGLQAIVGPSAPTSFQELSGSTYRRWNGTRVDGGAAAASPLLITNAQIAARRKSGAGAKWDFAFTSPEQAAKLVYGSGSPYGAGYARYSPGEVNKLGNGEVPVINFGFGDLSVQADLDLPAKSIFFGKKSDLLFIELHGIKLEEFGGVTSLPAYDASTGGVLAADQMWFVLRANFGCRRRNEFCELYNLA